MASVQALFPRFSGMDQEMETDLEMEIDLEMETDLEMVGFHLEIQCLHRKCTHKCNQINF